MFALSQIRLVTNSNPRNNYLWNYIPTYASKRVGCPLTRNRRSNAKRLPIVLENSPTHNIRTSIQTKTIRSYKKLINIDIYVHEYIFYY